MTDTINVPVATLMRWEGELDQIKGAGHISDEIVELFNSQATAQPAPIHDAWIPVGERLPDGIVLAHYRNHYGTGRTIRAQYVKPFTVEADADYDDVECCTYSEQDDCYYLEEGWYEQIDNCGDYSSVAVTEGQVTHWMPLPAAPEANKP